MTKEQLVSRVEELKNELDKSAAHHNALLGRLSESMHMLSMFELHEKSGLPCSDLEMSPVDEATCAA